MFLSEFLDELLQQKLPNLLRKSQQFSQDVPAAGGGGELPIQIFRVRRSLSRHL